MVQGDADEVVPPDQVFDWLANVEPRPTLIRMPGVGHYFHGKLVELREAIVAALLPSMP